MKRWKCNLCNMEIPEDELIEERKERHRTFHVDESLGTGGRKRNWTFGKVFYTELDQVINPLAFFEAYFCWQNQLALLAGYFVPNPPSGRPPVTVHAVYFAAIHAPI